MSKKIILILYIILYSCTSSLPESTGEYNEINIYVSDKDKKILDYYLKDILSKKINTPVLENVFKSIYNKPDFFFKNKNNSNILIISLTEPQDSTIDLLYDKISKEVQVC